MQAVQRKTEHRPPATTGKRVVKIEGNVAYISTGTARKQKADTVRHASHAARTPAVKTKPRSSSVIRTEAKAKRREHKGLVSTIVVLFVAFCALALLVSRYAAVCVINNENNKIKSDIQSIEARIEELKVQIEMSGDLEYVRNTAIGKLKMTYPDQSQRLNLDMN